MRKAGLFCIRLLLAAGVCIGVQAFAATPSPLLAKPDLGPHDVLLAQCFSQMHGASEAALAAVAPLLADTAAPVEAHIRAHACSGMAQMTLGQADAAQSHAQAMVTLLQTPGLPDTELFRGYAAAAGIFGGLGEWERAMALHQQAYERARQYHDVRLQITTLIAIAAIQQGAMADPALAEATLRQAIDLAVPAQMEDPVLYYNLGYTLLALGRLDEAMAAFDRSRRMLDTGAARLPGQAPAEQLLARIDTHRGVILGKRGDIAGGRTLIEASIATQTRLSDSQGRAASLVHLGALQLQAGDATAALASVQQALALAEQGRFRDEQRQALNQLADIHTALDQPALALEMVRREHALETGVLRGRNLRDLAGLQSQLSEDMEHAGIDRATRVRNLALGTLVIVLVFGGGIAWFQSRLNRRLRRTSHIDPVTGLLNRREATRRLDADLLPANVGPGHRAGLLMLAQVDDIQRINDSHGHAIGDQVLQLAAARLQELCGSDGVLARWDGVEFLVAHPDRTRQQAIALAEQVRAGFSATPLQLADGTSMTLTLSIGLAPHPVFPQHDGTSWQDALRLADHAAHAARQRGHDAWVGIWGTTAGIGTPLETILHGSERAQIAGWIEVHASRPPRGFDPEVLSPATDAATGTRV